MAVGGLLQRPDDRFANVGAAQVTESAANTITFQELQFPISLGAGVGLLIDQIDYYLTNDLVVAAGDFVHMAWSLRDDVTTLVSSFNQRSIIHTCFKQIVVLSAVGFETDRWPWTYQFFPPLLVAPNRGRLFLGVQGVSLSAAAIVQSRIYTRYLPLTDRDYLELAEAFDLIG